MELEKELLEPGMVQQQKKQGKGIVRASHRKKNGFLILPHPLTNFEIQKYYHNEPKLYGVYSRDNLPKNKGWGVCNKS